MLGLYLFHAMLYAWFSLNNYNGVVQWLSTLSFALFQIITTFSVVDNMKQQFYAQQGKISRFCNFFLITLWSLLTESG